MLLILEIFNGVAVDDSGWAATTSTENDQTIRTYAMTQHQAGSVLAAYTKLRDSAYWSLVGQTRLRPYLDSISFIDAGMRLDTSASN